MLGTFRLIGSKGKGKSKSTSSRAGRLPSTYEEPGDDSQYGFTPPSESFNNLTDEDIAKKFEQMLDDMNLTEEKKAPLRKKDMNAKRAMLVMQNKVPAKFDRMGGTLRLGGSKEKGKSKSTSSRAGRLPSTYEEPGDDSQYGFMPPSESFSNLTDEDIAKKFEQMLDDMNLTEEKKAPLRKKDMNAKRAMLIMHNKVPAKKSGELDSPQSFVAELRNPDLKGEKRLRVLESLRVSLTSNPVSWCEEFGVTGLNAILNNLIYCCDSKSERKAKYECVQCLKAFMNSKFGFREIIKHEEALTILSLTVDPSDATTMLEAVKILAAVCLVPPDGHMKVLEGITVCGEIRSQDRFLPVICGLGMQDNIQMQVSCIQLVNAIVSTPDDLDFRLHLRNEIMRTGLIDLIKQLENQKEENLQIQLTVFHDHKEEDQEELSHRYDNARVEFDDPVQCFQLIYNTVKDTIAEPYYLSILQHFLFIRDEVYTRAQYYKLIEECVTQIVLHRNGLDPDFRHTKRFNIDVQPLLSSFAEKSKIEDMEVSIIEMTSKYEASLTAKQESEAKVSTLEEKVKQLEGELANLKGRVNEDVGNKISNVIIRGRGPPLQPIPSDPPPSPPLPPGMRPIPLPCLVHLVLHQHDHHQSLCFPMAKCSLRRNITSVNVCLLEKDSFWVKANEKKFESPDLLSELVENFSTKTVTKDNNEAQENKPAKKGKELKVLDPKAGQNLSILLGSIKIPYSEIKRHILEMDEENLTSAMIEQLIKYMPEPEQMNQLAGMIDNYDELAEPEQFTVTMSSIKNLIPRLKSMLFKMKFPETVSDIKPDLVSAIKACEEVRSSSKFSQILELILHFVNVLNAGSRNAQSPGFKISFLSKLQHTKSKDGKTTLMHFLANIIEKKYPDLLNFYEELNHCDKAAQVSDDNLKKNITQMEKQLSQLETDLKAAGKSPDGDKFGDFVTSATGQFEVLCAMYNKLDSLYKDLGKYFCFDPFKYTLDEFFGDIKTFKENFLQAVKDNVKLRETEEKIRCAKEAMEKSEREKQAKVACKEALVDMTTGSLAEKSRFEDMKVSIIEMTSKYEASLTAKQESEAKVSTLEEKVKQLEGELANLKGREVQND
ncbi:hypothetical protein ACJMK2_030907 [Sinanodonta woodiana]|uniref:Uncharacterized protein n=1 Tax=Sinanodonta woodiana TaxID=1069815 RepID=A0ABD3WX74_SINWO